MIAAALAFTLLETSFQKSSDGAAIAIRHKSLRCVTVTAAAAIFSAALWLRRPSWGVSGLCFALLVGGCSHAPSDPQTAGQAVATLAFDDPLGRLGVLSPSVSTTHDFSFQVWDERPVTITAIDAGCGCTIPDKRLIGKPLEPGSIHRLAVAVRPDGEAMTSTKTLRIRTEPPSVVPLVLAVSYTRKDPPQLSHKFLHVKCGPDERGEAQVVITHRRREDQPSVGLDYTRCQFGDFSVVAAEAESETVPRHAVLAGSLGVDTTTVTLRANRSWPYGRRDGEMLLAFDDGTSRALPTRIEVPHPIALFPDSLFAGVLKPGQVIQKKVHVKLPSEMSAERLAARGTGAVSAEIVGGFVVATIRAPAAAGRLEGELVVTVSGQESLARTMVVEGICAQ